jgi:hypothetical protein
MEFFVEIVHKGRVSKEAQFCAGSKKVHTLVLNNRVKNRFTQNQFLRIENYLTKNSFMGKFF